MVLSCNVVEAEELRRSSGVWIRERLPDSNAARLGGTLAEEVAEDEAATMRAWYSGKIWRGKEGIGFARGTSEPAPFLA
jgi:hypothetical protein